MNGKGNLLYRNRDEYTGEFEEDLKHGQGKFAWATGEIYDG